jgi:hypothetical protein
MSNNLNFEHEGFTVNISYNSATNSVKRTVSDEGSEIYQDEINFDKSIVAEFDLMAEEEQEKLVNAWGAAGIKSRIEDGQFGSKH